MKSIFASLLVYVILSGQVVLGQTTAFDKVQFFKDETPLNVTLESYWSQVIKQKGKIGRVFPALFVTKLPDSTSVNEPVSLTVRGHFRRDYCNLPPLKVTFKKSANSVMHPLKSIKLVSTCMNNTTNEQYLLKEYLVYKIYNLLTEKSFRVRLLNMDYKDSSGKKSAFTGPGFLMEDIKDMAKRNNAKEWSKRKIHSESTDTRQMTLVAMFEFMIGNGDWSVPGEHNIKLIQSLEDSNSIPFAVPYDFDYAGLINTEYAVPDPLLEVESVVERVYRGYARTMEELNETIEIFNKQKGNIYSLINNFELLNSKNKKGMVEYLESFYRIINKPKEVQLIFIDNARKDN